MTVTLKHVADAAGVAVSTASMALADHPRLSAGTKKRIREVSVRLGYLSDIEIAARRQRTGPGLRFLFLGLGECGRRHVREDIILRLVANPRQTGVRVEVASIDHDTDSARLAAQIRDLTRDCHGVMLYGLVNRELLEAVAVSVPTVLIGPLMRTGSTNARGDLRAVSLGFPHVEMGREATEALIAAGHRRIALISAKGDIGLYYGGWEDGYIVAMTRAGLPLVRDLSAGKRLEKGELPRCADGGLPTAYVIPDPTYHALLQRVMLADGLELQAGQVVLGLTPDRQRSNHLEKWPAIVMDVGVMLEVAMTKLIELNGRAPGRFQEINLAWTDHAFDRISPPNA